MERNVSSVVLEKTVESSVDCKKIQLVHPKGNQSWILLGSSDAEAETQYFGHLMQRTDSLEKTLMVGKIEGGRRRTIEDKMFGWHHQLNGYEFVQAPGIGDGQGSLTCCNLWGWRVGHDWVTNTFTFQEEKGRHHRVGEEEWDLVYVQLPASQLNVCVTSCYLSGGLILFFIK